MSWGRSIGARVFIASMAMAGALCLALAFSHWHSSDPVKFTCYLIAAALASSLKVSLPGIEGTLSVNFLFTLLGILELSLPETLVIGLASTLAQFYWKPVRRVKVVQLVFNLSQVTVSSGDGTATETASGTATSPTSGIASTSAGSIIDRTARSRAGERSRTIRSPGHSFRRTGRPTTS